MKKMLIIVAIIIVIGLIIVAVTGKKSNSSTTTDTNSEKLTFTDEPDQYSNLILENTPNQQYVVLETYKGGSARMFFDYKTAPEGEFDTRQEDGTFVYSDDKTEIIVTLNGHGDWEEVQTPYNPPSVFTFIKTATGIKATSWDKTRYDFDSLELATLPVEERFYFGNPMEA